MDFLILTQYSGKILGPIAKYILGPILNGIFIVLDKINIPNIGLAIIIFTIVIYLLMLPLTIKQQKFSKLQAKMQPELQAIQEKYKNKKDQDSQMAMNQETQAVYSKYGVSPTGSCLQLLIQMPILFALYRVIYSIPAYVTKVGNTFRVLADSIISSDGGAYILNNTDELSTVKTALTTYSKNIDADLTNGIIDVLNKCSSSDLDAIANHYNLTNLTYDGQNIFTYVADNGDKVKGLIDRFNVFLGINIGNSPSYTVSEAFKAGSYLLILGAILIPVLSAVTQWINVKLTPQAANNNKSTGNAQADQMQNSMKAMNTFMPIFSAIMCYTLPAGLGLYWIAGSVVRSIQQIAINKYIDKLDLDEVIKKNVEKRDARYKKAGIDPAKLQQNAYMSTKSVSMSSKANINNKADSSSGSNTASGTSVNYTSNAKPGSIAAKANMVREYNERNNNK